MRSRNLKPGFFSNEILAELPFEGRLLFAGLWCLADREGRLEDRPKRIKGELFRFDCVDVEDLLVQLEKKKFIIRYEHSGLAFIQLINFLKHQSPHYNEKPSVIPSGPDQKSQTLQSTVESKVPDFSSTVGDKVPVLSQSSPSLVPDFSSTVGDRLPPDSLIPDSLIPDSLIPDSKRSHVNSPKNPAIDLPALWAKLCPSLPQIQGLSQWRKDKIRIRLKKHPDPGYWTEVFSKMESSEFLRGNGGWKADFNWIIKNEDNALKVLEGNYDGCTKTPNRKEAFPC